MPVTIEQLLQSERRSYRVTYLAMMLTWLSCAFMPGMVFAAVMFTIATHTHRKALRVLESRHPYARLLK
jgi:hypothetical protein